MTPSPRTNRKGTVRFCVCGEGPRGQQVMLGPVGHAGICCCSLAAAHLDDLLVCLIVNLHGGDGLLGVAQDHVQVLVVSLQCSPRGMQVRPPTSQRPLPQHVTLTHAHVQSPTQLPVATQLDINALVQGKPDEIKRLLHRGCFLFRHF